MQNFTIHNFQVSEIYLKKKKKKKKKKKPIYGLLQ